MKKILIIEDDRSIAELERDYLEVNGFAADLQSSGPAGLAAAQKSQYDLIILDVMLPGADGFEICRQLRTITDVPILMVSARKEDIDKIRGLGLGADDYITKPFSPGELVARVKAHLSRYQRLMEPREQAKDEIKIRGIVIDKNTRTVLVNEREVSLTGKEFELLALLAAHPNRVFTRDELFERIWDMNSNGEISTVTVHIRKLREKIEMDPSNPQYIETLWGVGYRFKV